MVFFQRSLIDPIVSPTIAPIVTLGGTDREGAGLGTDQMMANRSTAHSGASVPIWVRRLQRGRFLLAFIAVVMLALWAFDLVTPIGALIAFLGLVLAVLLIPMTVQVSDPIGGPGVQATVGLMPGTLRFAESLPDPCFILAQDGAVRYANDRAVAVFGIQAGELLTFRLRYPELVAAFDRVTKGAGPQQVQFTERVPTERSFSAWFAALDSTPGDETYLLILDDLTEARATERMRADFVANASHELRTPLASLTGFVETLKGAAKDDTEAHTRFLGMMHEQATRMSRLIDDLLSLSRIEMRAHLLPGDRIELAALLQQVIDTMVPLARDLDVAIEAALPPDQVWVTGDRDELVQLFNNLIENACKYGQSGGRVIVRLESSGERSLCSVSVIDFGPGIAPEHLPRLTERFYRVDAAESRRHRGTGLGLAIVKHIVSRHRARLQIESDPGRGTKFTVQFPDSETIPSREEQNSA